MPEVPSACGPPDSRESDLQLADLQPSLLLEGENPRLIDEWQMAPQLWDAVRRSVDSRGKPGLDILTGSSSVDKSRIRHSGAGRISRLKMYTMSLFESGDSSGTVSLEGLFAGQPAVAARSELKIRDYARLLVRGGWPGTVGKSERVSRRLPAGYCDAIVKSEIAAVDGVSRDERKTNAVLRSYARHTATQAVKTTIPKDIEKPRGHAHQYAGLVSRGPEPALCAG